MSWTAPKTWAVGDPGTSPDLNTYVRDNTNFLYGDTSWAAPAFTNGWGSFAGLPAGFRKIGTRVVFQGGLASGTAGTSALTLPAGYRPTANRNFAVDSGSFVYAVITIASSGTVTPNSGAGNTYVSLDGITFDTI